MAENAKDDANRLNVTPDTFLQAVEELAELTKKKDSAVGAIRRTRQKFKGLGIDLKELDGAVEDKKRHDDDPSAFEMSLAARERYRKWLLIPVGAQADLGLQEPTQDHKDRLTKFDTHKQGYDAGKRADPRSGNPYEAGTIAHVSWDNGWSDGDNDAFNGAKPAQRVAAKGDGPELDPQPVDNAANLADEPKGDAPVTREPHPLDVAELPGAEMPDIPESLRRPIGETVQ